MSILPKETIQVIAQSIGISSLPDDVAAALAPDVEYRIREIVQEAMKCMLHSKRTTLTTDDVNSALQLRNVEPLYGFASGGPLRFKKVLGHTDLFYIDDKDIEFKDIIEAPLPKAPLDTAVVAHWLAIEGVQPAIPENVSLESLTSTLETRKTEGQSLKRKAEELAVDVKLPIKHVLSRELQLYFEKITELTITGVDSVPFKDALISLATDSGIHPLVPYFTQFVADEVTRSLDDFPLLFSLMRVVQSLLLNPHIHIEPYLHQLMPSVITCLVAKRLGRKLVENHWELRDYTANLIAFICKRFGHVYQNLQPRVTRTLLHAFLDPKRAMTQHYGAVQGLAALGPRVVQLLVLPNLEPYLQLLAPEMSLESQKNEVKRYEAWRVYGSLLHAAGICMYEKLRSCPAFHAAHTWKIGGVGKVAIPLKNSGGLPSNPSLAQLASPSKKWVIEIDSTHVLQKKLMNDNAVNGRPEPSVGMLDVLSGDVDSNRAGHKSGQISEESVLDGGRRTLKVSDNDRANFSLAEAWKEDVDTGPLLASLIELFGEGILPFVPKNELLIHL